MELTSVCILSLGLKKTVATSHAPFNSPNSLSPPSPTLLALISAFRNKMFLLLATAIAKSVKHFSTVTNTTKTPAIDKH